MPASPRKQFVALFAIAICLAALAFTFVRASISIGPVAPRAAGYDNRLNQKIADGAAVVEVLQLIDEYPHFIDQERQGHRPAIQVAVMLDRPDLITLLLERGSDPLLRMNTGTFQSQYNAIELATIQERCKMVSILLDYFESQGNPVSNAELKELIDLAEQESRTACSQLLISAAEH